MKHHLSIRSQWCVNRNGVARVISLCVCVCVCVSVEETKSPLTSEEVFSEEFFRPQSFRHFSFYHWREASAK